MTISECVRSSPGWGVVKSLELIGSGPVGLVHTQKIEAQSEKPTWTKALEFTLPVTESVALPPNEETE